MDGDGRFPERSAELRDDQFDCVFGESAFAVSLVCSRFCLESELNSLRRLVTSINAFLPLLNGTQFGAELQRGLSAAFVALQLANKELEAWSRQSVPFRQLLKNETAVAALLQQLGSSAENVTTLMGIPVKPKEVRLFQVFS